MSSSVPVEKNQEEMKETTTTTTVEVPPSAEENNHNNAAATATKKDDENAEVKKEAEIEPVPMLALFRYADKVDIAMYIGGAIACVIQGAAQPATMELMGRLIGELTSGGNFSDAIDTLALIMAMIAVGRLVFGTLSVGLFMAACERQSSRIRTMYVDALLRQEMGFHDTAKPGALTAALVGDIQIYRNGTNDKLATGLIMMATFLTGYGLAFYHSWKLTLVSIGVMPLAGIAGAIMRRKTVDFVAANRKAYGKAGEISDEAFQNYRTLQILGLEDRIIKRFEDALEEAHWPGLMKDASVNLGQGVMTFLLFSSYSLTFWFSSYLIGQGESNVGELTTVFFCLLMASFGLISIIPTFTGLAEASGAIAKVYSVLDRQPTIVSGTKKIDDADFKGEFTFENVEFRYPAKLDMPLFKNFNLKIEAGTRVAFSGPSGNGKSTLISLAQRLYDPLAGRVLVDGIDMKELDLAWFRSKVGVVSQEPVLFSGTIKDNVKFGKPNATDEEVIQACKMAAIHDTIMNLPDGYDTNSGSVGSQLSGGQKQRIAIARALILKPRILILDEATSALDRKSEMDVQGAIDDLVVDGNFTVLVIAHRLATIATCDVIHYIERDELVGSDVIESGSFKDLMLKGGQFASMASRQSKSAAAALQQALSEDNIGSSEKTNNNAPDAQTTTTNINVQNNADDDDGFAVDPVGAPGEGPTTKKNTNKNKSNSIRSDSLKNDSFSGSAGGRQRSDSMRQLTAHILELEEEDNKKAGVEPKKTKEEIEAEHKARTENALKDVAEKEKADVDASLSRVAAMMKGKYWMIVLGVIGSLFVGGIMPAYAVVFSKTIAVLGYRDKAKMEDEIIMWICLFLAVAGLALIGTVLQCFYAIAGEEMTTEMRLTTFRAILRQDATFFDMPGRDPGGLQSLLSGDCESVHQLFGPVIGPVVQLIGCLGAGLGIAFAHSWKLSLVILACLPAIMFGGALRNKMYQGFSKAMDDSDPSATIFGESMRNIRTVVAFNAIDRQRTSFEAADAESVSEGMKIAWVSGFSFGFMQFSMGGIFSLGMWYGGQLMLSDGLEFFDVMVCIMGIVMAGMNAGESAGLLARQKDAEIGARRVFAVVDRVPDVNIFEPNAVDNNYVASPEHTIDFVNTSFTYPARPKIPVLKGFTEKILGGQSIGLMGTTGSGKSTAISLICRFYDPCPEKDSLEVDGTKLRTLDLIKWRAKIGAVLQEPSLFDGTIRDNLLLGVRNPEAVTEEEIITACKRAALYDTILDFPKGFDTPVGMRGCQLSGGQKQRCAIARALLSKPEILVMDEGTSALDNFSEGLVMEGLAEMRKEHNMTVISVAHRLSTIKDCDNILLLDQGVVLESGNHEKLVALNGEYKKRWDLFVAATE